MNIIFFGSTSDSILVLRKLTDVVAVVTQTPKPIGRKKILTPTPVEVWAKHHRIPVFYSPPAVAADLLVSASYGEKIPMETIRSAQYGGLNVHPSLLPRWRGGDPVPWAIFTGDKETGVSVVTLSEKFDQGEIIAQETISITPTDFSGPLRTKLFALGAELLIHAIQDHHFSGPPQQQTNQPYAKRLTRQDGFEPWNTIMDPKEAERINRKYRAFHPWPGLWTIYNGKRLKILEFTQTPTVVQLEGKNPLPFTQFRQAYLPS